MKQFLLAILLGLVTAGQASAQVIFIPVYLPPAKLPEPKPADFSNIHSVAVISTLGDRFLMSTNHFMAAQQRQLDISGWGINDKIKARLVQYLPRFTFRDVPFDHAALAAEPSTILDRPDNLSSFLATLPKDVVDAYIVVRPATVYRGPGFNGLALQNAGAFGADADAIVWANFQIIFVDARTSTVMTKSYSRLRLRDNAPPSFAGMTAPDALKLKDDFALSADQATELEKVTNLLLSNTIAETLRSLGLNRDLPAPGARALLPVPADKFPYREYKTAAVVSTLGDQFRFEHAGSIFEQTVTNIARPDWGVDDFVEASARKELGSRLQIVPSALPREALAKAATWDDRRIPPKLADFTADPAVDLYVVFVDTMLRVGDAWQEKGLGVIHNTSMSLMPKGTFSFANYGVLVIDAKRKTIIAHHEAVSGPTQMADQPFRRLDDAAWSGTAKNLPDNQAKLVHDGLTTILEDSIQETLLQLGLLGVTAVPAAMASPAGQAAN